MVNLSSGKGSTAKLLLHHLDFERDHEQWQPQHGLALALIMSQSSLSSLAIFTSNLISINLFSSVEVLVVPLGLLPYPITTSRPLLNPTTSKVPLVEA